MKKFLPFLIVFAISTIAYPQLKRDSGQLPDTYLRNSITAFFVEKPGITHWSRTKQKIQKMDFPDKYDNHNLDNLFISPSAVRRGSEDEGQMQRILLRELVDNDVPRKIIAKWYNRQNDGTMDMELVHQRGRFAATDRDFVRAGATRRGDAALQDLGNQLLNRSYVLVIDFSTIQNMNETDSDDREGWRAELSGYLYKVDFNEEVRSLFYDTWIYDDDSEEEKARKREAFNNIEIPLTYVTRASATVRSTQSKRYGRKTEDQLLQELVQLGYEEILYDFERRVPEFQVVTPLYGTRPLRAKIGLKENLKTDVRFFVFEHVYNARTNTAEPVRRGVVRAGAASQIHDNRHEAFGDMGTSQFYQVHGRRLREGYTLVQQNDLGMEFTLGTEIGELGGFYGRFDLRTGRITGIRAFFVFVELGLDAKSYEYPGSFDDETFSFIRAAGGLAKGMQLGANLELRPYVGVGLELASNDDIFEEDIKAYYFKPGVNLALNLTHNFQLVGGAGSYMFFTEALDDEDNALGEWDAIFKDRQGLSVFAGIKFML